MESLWVTVAAAVLVVGVAPGLMVVCRGSAVQRLVGLALLNATGTMALIALSVAANQSSYLIVALVLAVLSSTGTLVYTRLLGPESGARGNAGQGAQS